MPQPAEEDWTPAGFRNKSNDPKVSFHELANQLTTEYNLVLSMNKSLQEENDRLLQQVAAGSRSPSNPSVRAIERNPSKASSTGGLPPQPPEPVAPPAPIAPGDSAPPSAEAVRAAGAAAQAVMTVLGHTSPPQLASFLNGSSKLPADFLDTDDQMRPYVNGNGRMPEYTDSGTAEYTDNSESWERFSKSISQSAQGMTPPSSENEDEDISSEEGLYDGDAGTKGVPRKQDLKKFSMIKDIQEVITTAGSRGRRLSFVRSSMFDYVTSIILILNAFTMGLQVDFAVQNSTDVMPLVYRWVDWVFLVCFTSELLLRLAAYGAQQFFRGPSWGWNAVDTLLVGAQIVEEAIGLLAYSGITDSKVDVNLQAFRVLRVLRITRLVRLVRLVRLIRELHAMVLSIFSSLKSFLWALFLLFIIIYVMAIFTAQSVAGLQDIPPDVRRYCTSLPSIVFNLFQSMSGGLDWGQMAGPLVEVTGWPTALLFTAFIAFTVFVMMNVVTGVFVDAAQNSIKEEKEKDLLLRLKEAFVVMDEDNSRSLTWKEFKKQLDHPRMIDYFKAVELDVTHARSLFMLLDSGTGQVSLDDFVWGCLRLCGPARAIDHAILGRNHDRKLKSIALKVKEMKQHVMWLTENQIRSGNVHARGISM
mmetsp:Transcript_20358/g.36388  ORF Transcript_20358/g.36388 Transcript_20358/m.36388 type:complete len:644 (+) Transcript_20358:87-2018(+)